MKFKNRNKRSCPSIFSLFQLVLEFVILITDVSHFHLVSTLLLFDIRLCSVLVNVTSLD